jgi:hypothetical protein
MDRWNDCRIDCQCALDSPHLPESSRTKVQQRLYDADMHLKSEKTKPLYSVDEKTVLQYRNEIASALSGDVKIVYKESYGRMIVSAQPLAAGKRERDETLSCTRT